MGKIVSIHFFWAEHVEHDVDPGPFRQTSDWIEARLSLNELDCDSTLREREDEDDVEDAERTLDIIIKLRSYISKFFPDTGIAEPTMLHHDDLSMHNIMVNHNGVLTGVIDWECVSAVPLWKACDFPSFLKGRPRDAKPDLKKYQGNGKSGLEPDSLYSEHMMEYEQHLLRRFFLDQMRNLEPDWIKVFESSRTLRDFDTAMQRCDDEFAAKHIDAWIDDLDKSKEDASLEDLMNANYVVQ